jgi:ABC-type uncharacterized transport system YnjBCD ATPase subunit
MMRPPTDVEKRAWIAQWRTAAVALERVRVSEHRAMDLAEVAAELDEALLASVRQGERSEHSGLVEQQRLFGLTRG